MRLQGKVAIVTGAAREMGEAEAWLFAREGACGVLSLASDETSFATGTELVIDGGYFAQ